MITCRLNIFAHKDGQWHIMTRRKSSVATRSSNISTESKFVIRDNVLDYVVNQMTWLNYIQKNLGPQLVGGIQNFVEGERAHCKYQLCQQKPIGCSNSLANRSFLREQGHIPSVSQSEPDKSCSILHFPVPETRSSLTDVQPQDLTIFLDGLPHGLDNGAARWLDRPVNTQSTTI